MIYRKVDVMKNILKISLSVLLVFSLVFSFASCNFFSGFDPDGSFEKPKAEIDYAKDDGRIKNVILIIGDGMGEAQLDAGELAYSEEFAFRDELTKFYSNTNSLNTSTKEPTEVTDSAASATALASGILTYNKLAGKTPDNEDTVTLLDIASEAKKSTAVVTTDYLTGATPAGFTAHTLNRNLENEIIKSQIKSGVDLLIGQYYDLYDDYESSIKANYDYYTSYDEDKISKSEKALCLLDIEQDTENSVSLSKVTELAIDFLSKDKDGFVLVVEQAHIDKRCHNKDFEGAAEKAKSLNETVETALQFAKCRDDTAVIVTADHETCGLQVSADPTLYSTKFTTDTGAEISYSFTATSHTDTLVPVYTYGFEPVPEICPTYTSGEKIKNCEIFLIVKDLILYS